jgi:hypothetical protein
MLTDVLGNVLNIGDYIAAIGFSGLDIGEIIEFQNNDTLVIKMIKNTNVFNESIQMKGINGRKDTRFVRPDKNAIKISKDAIMLYLLQKESNA